MDVKMLSIDDKEIEMRDIEDDDDHQSANRLNLDIEFTKE
jgi:DNA-directed RNA polymerase subunit beta